MTHRGRTETATLSANAARLAEIVRALAASVNVRLLAALAAERRARGEEAWVYLSDLADRLGESPGTVAAAVGRLLVAGLVEEQRLKGRRYFRARYAEVGVSLRV